MSLMSCWIFAEGAVRLDGLALFAKDAIEWIIFIVVAIIAGLTHLANASKAKKNAQAGPKPAEPPRAQAKANRPQGEVEDFLRRVAKNRAKGGQAGESPAPARVARPEPVPTLAPAADSAPLGSGVAQHVSQHINTGEFAQRTAHLSQVDESVSEHLHEAFDHQVGRLATAKNAPRESGPRTRAVHPILAALMAPGGVKQALVLSEILRRPDEHDATR